MVSFRIIGLIGFMFGIIMTTLVISVILPNKGGGGGGGVNSNLRGTSSSDKSKENIKYQPPAKK